MNIVAIYHTLPAVTESIPLVQALSRYDRIKPINIMAGAIRVAKASHGNLNTSEAHAALLNAQLIRARSDTTGATTPARTLPYHLRAVQAVLNTMASGESSVLSSGLHATAKPPIVLINGLTTVAEVHWAVGQMALILPVVGALHPGAELVQPELPHAIASGTSAYYDPVLDPVYYEGGTSTEHMVRSVVSILAKKYDLG